MTTPTKPAVMSGLLFVLAVAGFVSVVKADEDQPAAPSADSGPHMETGDIFGELASFDELMRCVTFSHRIKPTSPQDENRIRVSATV